MTSALFLSAILLVVVYLTRSKADTVDLVPGDASGPQAHARGGMWQTTVAVFVLVGGGTIGYAARSSALDRATAQLASGSASAGPAKLGDLSPFRTIVRDTRAKLDGGDQSGATKRVGDLEVAWDEAQPKLQPLDGQTWTIIDGKVDTVLKKLRSSSPNVADEDAALVALLQTLDAVSPASSG